MMIAKRQRAPSPAAAQSKRSMESNPEMTKAARILGISTESPDYALTRPKTSDSHTRQQQHFLSRFPEPLDVQEEADVELSEGSGDDFDMDPKTPTHGLTAMPKSKSNFLSSWRKSTASKPKANPRQSFSTRWRTGEKKEQKTVTPDRYQRPKTAGNERSTPPRKWSTVSEDPFARGPSPLPALPVLPSFLTSSAPLSLDLIPLPLTINKADDSMQAPPSPAMTTFSVQSAVKPLPPIPIPLRNALRLSSFAPPPIAESRMLHAQHEVVMEETASMTSEKPSLVSVSTASSIPPPTQAPRCPLPAIPQTAAPELEKSSPVESDSSAEEQLVAEIAKKRTISSADFPAVPSRRSSRRSSLSRDSVATISKESAAEPARRQSPRSERTASSRTASYSRPLSARRSSSAGADRRNSSSSWGRRSMMIKRNVSSAMAVHDLAKQSMLSLSSESDSSGNEETRPMVEQIIGEEDEEAESRQRRPPSDGSMSSSTSMSRSSSNDSEQRRSGSSLASTALTVPSATELETRPSVESLNAKVQADTAPSPARSPSLSSSSAKVMILSQAEIALIKALRQDKTRKAQMATEAAAERAAEEAARASAGFSTHRSRMFSDTPLTVDFYLEDIAEHSVQGDSPPSAILEVDEDNLSAVELQPSNDMGSWKFRQEFNFSLTDSSREAIEDSLISPRSKPATAWPAACPNLEDSFPTPPTSRCSPLTPTLAQQILASLVPPLNIETRSAQRPAYGHCRRRTASSECLFLNDNSSELDTAEGSLAGRNHSRDLWSGLDELDLVG